MSDDIVKQLSELAPTLKRGEGRSTVYGAVQEIERLRGQILCWEDTVRAIARKISEANCG